MKVVQYGVLILSMLGMSSNVFAAADYAAAIASTEKLQRLVTALHRTVTIALSKAAEDVDAAGFTDFKGIERGGIKNSFQNKLDKFNEGTNSEDQKVVDEVNIAVSGLISNLQAKVNAAAQ